MTTRPRLFTEANYVNGIAALLLFVVLAAVFVGAGFPFPEGFGEASITATIGYAMFDMLDQAAYESEGFLVAFEIIDFVLVAALVGAVMLARREEEGSLVTALTDGGGLRDRGSTDTQSDTRSDAESDADARADDARSDAESGADARSDVRSDAESGADARADDAGVGDADESESATGAGDGATDGSDGRGA